MEFIVERVKNLGWSPEGVQDVGNVTVYRFLKDSPQSMELYLGIKDGNTFIYVADKRIGFRINVSPERGAVELYTYAIRRYNFDDIEKLAEQFFEELELLYNEALSVAKVVQKA